MTGTFDWRARRTIAAAALTSTASRTSTFAPPVSAASACDCCLAGSWSALEYTTLQSGHSCSTRFSKRGRSCWSWRVVLDSGSSRAILPPFVLEPSSDEPQAATTGVTAASAAATTAVWMRMARVLPAPADQRAHDLEAVVEHADVRRPADAQHAEVAAAQQSRGRHGRRRDRRDQVGSE